MKALWKQSKLLAFKKDCNSIVSNIFLCYIKSKVILIRSFLLKLALACLRPNQRHWAVDSLVWCSQNPFIFEKTCGQFKTKLILDLDTLFDSKAWSSEQHLDHLWSKEQQHPYTCSYRFLSTIAVETIVDKSRDLWKLIILYYVDGILNFPILGWMPKGAVPQSIFQCKLQTIYRSVGWPSDSLWMSFPYIF